MQNACAVTRQGGPLRRNRGTLALLGPAERLAAKGAGDGVLVFDPDGRGAITGKRQSVVTEWGERRLGNAPGGVFQPATARSAGQMGEER